MPATNEHVGELERRLTRLEHLRRPAPPAAALLSAAPPSLVTGNGAPSQDVDGGMYLDLQTGAFWGPKTDTWPPSPLGRLVID
jgi:hypothetical protein